MSDSSLLAASSLAIPLPPSRVGIRIRPGTLEDIPAIDRLQKQHHKQLGFMNRPTLEGKVKLGHVLVAERHEGSEARRHEGREGAPLAASVPSCLGASVPSVIGYLIGNDRYKHRDELGVIFQMCVAPEFRRSLVAANLLKAQFERSAYGCKLYCCWCAQDIEANKFWESMGFIAIAFRTGGKVRHARKRHEGTQARRHEGEDGLPSVPSCLNASVPSARLHIFWQKRIREGDVTTPWWFPSETSGGMMDAARIALPIPPGMTWQDELPRLLPREQLPVDPCQTSSVESLPVEKQQRAKKRPPSEEHRRPAVGTGALFFGRRKDAAVEKPRRAKPPKKNDPVLAARARELRDRYLEQFNSNPPGLPDGKYEVCRVVESRPAVPLLAA